MLKPGDDVDSWCGTCKRLLAHTVEAMVDDVPARVHCNTCKAQHKYKPYMPGQAPQNRAPAQGSGLPSTSISKSEGEPV